MPKIDRTTANRRIHEIMQLILAGGEFPDIWQYVSDKGWNISQRQTRRYIELAYRRIKTTMEPDQDQLLARHFMQRRALYARCIKASDFRTALQVLRDEAELHGLYPAKKIAPTTPDGKEPYDPTGRLGEIVCELRTALDRLGCGPGAEAPEHLSAQLDLGDDEAGQGPDHGPGGPASGSLAEALAALASAQDPVTLLPPVGQEHDDGSPGPAGGAP